MIIEKLEHIREIDTIENMEDIREVFKSLIDYTIKLEKTLNDVLGHLDSDNIYEVDFGRTRYRNQANTLLKDYATKLFVGDNYATKVWVTENFQPKV